MATKMRDIMSPAPVRAVGVVSIGDLALEQDESSGLSGFCAAAQNS